MNGGQKIPGKLIVSRSYATEVFEPAEAALDDVSSFVGTFVEAMNDDPVGFVGNDWFGPAANDFSAELVAVVALVANEG
jgi:hypothetical protein